MYKPGKNYSIANFTSDDTNQHHVSADEIQTEKHSIATKNTYVETNYDETSNDTLNFKVTFYKIVCNIKKKK